MIEGGFAHPAAFADLHDAHGLIAPPGKKPGSLVENLPPGATVFRHELQYTDRYITLSSVPCSLTRTMGVWLRQRFRVDRLLEGSLHFLTMQPADLHEALARILAHSPAFPTETLAVDLIANPRAGGFTRLAYARRRFAELDHVVARAEALPMRLEPLGLRLHLTERMGHASDIARSIVEDARSDAPNTRRIILTAGGDGTSLETASVLAGLHGDLASRFALVRLPFGTGNDGSEGRTLEEALGRFLGPVVAAPRTALRITPNPSGGKEALWSFNIASIGVDAFVSHMTNKLKSFLPGDSYKLWVDVASVFYDLIWPPAPLSMKAQDGQGRETFAFTSKCLLCAVGASGHRTYGSNKPILPDDDNACVVFQMSLGKKLAFKDRIASGGHRGLGEDIVRLFSGRRFEFGYSAGILLQRDGEVIELAPADFPLLIEVTEPLYHVVEAAPTGP